MGHHVASFHLNFECCSSQKCSRATFALAFGSGENNYRCMGCLSMSLGSFKLIDCHLVLHASNLLCGSCLPACLPAYSLTFRMRLRIALLQAVADCSLPSQHLYGASVLLRDSFEATARTRSCHCVWQPQDKKLKLSNAAENRNLHECGRCYCMGMWSEVW